MSKFQKDMMQTASDMRDQSRVLMHAAECLCATREIVKNTIFNKL